jgi:hypothetical protein
MRHSGPRIHALAPISPHLRAGERTRNHHFYVARVPKFVGFKPKRDLNPHVSEGGLEPPTRGNPPLKPCRPTGTSVALANIRQRERAGGWAAQVRAGGRAV